jgi:preprotein translocase subunit SecA
MMKNVHIGWGPVGMTRITSKENTKLKLKIDLVLDEKEYAELSINQVKERFTELLLSMMKANYENVIEEASEFLKRNLALSILDSYWTQHIDNMTKLKNGINYVAYANTDPVNTYINEGFTMFETMINNIAMDVVFHTLHFKIVRVEESKVA